MAASNSDTSAHQKGAWLLLNVASNTRLIREAIATGRGVALHHRLTDIKRPLELPRLLRLPSGLPGGVTPDSLQDAALCAVQRLARESGHFLVLCARADLAPVIAQQLRHVQQVLPTLVVLARHPEAADAVLKSGVLPQLLRVAAEQRDALRQLRLGERRPDLANGFGFSFRGNISSKVFGGKRNLVSQGPVSARTSCR